MPQSSAIRVLAVDDRDANHLGLMLFFRVFRDIQFVGRARSAQQALEMCKQHSPHVFLLDFKRPEDDCVLSTRLLKESCPQSQLIVLTNTTSQSFMHDVLNAGAAAVIEKNTSIDALAAAIRTAATYPLTALDR